MARRWANPHKIVKAKERRASRTYSKLARTYFVYPPAEGWPGGDPVKNGYRPSGGK
jgi:hypothetical protein